MKSNTYAMLKSILFIEMGIILYLHIYGKNGLSLLYEQKIVLNHIKKEISELQREIQLLEVARDEWSSHAFYKEKIARENLQMARKNDKIFYIKS
jgi:hypothetical protein